MAAGEVKRGKGRPTKAEVRDAAYELATANTTLSDDLARIKGTAN